VSFKVYYASDIHGSELLWRKFINAGRFYGAEVLIMGGDIAGKAVVPIVERGGAYYAPEVAGERPYAEDQVHALERRIRDLGMYPYRATADDLAALHGDQQAVDALFVRVMSETLRRWLEFAEERLSASGIRLYMMLGNDDEPSLRNILGGSRIAMDCEDRSSTLVRASRCCRAGSPIQRRGTRRARCRRTSCGVTSRGWPAGLQILDNPYSTCMCRRFVRRLTPHR
jgi:Icc-related predicted phosphoesterase